MTAGQYCEFLNAVAGTDTYGLYNTYMWSDSQGCKIERYAGSGSTADPYQYRVAAEWANRPVNYVSWADAARFANWLHNGQPTGSPDLDTTENGSYYLNGATSNEPLFAARRQANATWVVPSEDEWYKAAYHMNDGVTANYFGYPTSSNNQPSNILGDPNDPGNNATYYDYGGTGGYTIGSPYYRTEVGAHENSESPYGTFDQGGNVSEWAELNEDLPSYWWSRMVRGGSLYSLAYQLHSSDRDNFFDPTYEDNGFGFRIAVISLPICKVDFNALALFAAHWCDSGCDSGNNWCFGADLNKNNSVDLVDFASLSSYWQNSCPPDWPL